jgi:hypothetical protein
VPYVTLSNPFFEWFIRLIDSTRMTCSGSQRSPQSESWRGRLHRLRKMIFQGSRTPRETVSLRNPKGSGMLMSGAHLRSVFQPFHMNVREGLGVIWARLERFPYSWRPIMDGPALSNFGSPGRTPASHDPVIRIGGCDNGLANDPIHPH